jgi:hypothetical protein
MNTSLSRKRFLQGSAAAVAAAFVSPQAALANTAAASTSSRAMPLTQQPGTRSSPRAPKVDHQQGDVPGTATASRWLADLYLPKQRAAGRKLAGAGVVGGPFGAVKEQSSGLYAQTHGRARLRHAGLRSSYTGESGGEPRNVASPDINTEDFSAAVDFIGLHASCRS